MDALEQAARECIERCDSIMIVQRGIISNLSKVKEDLKQALIDDGYDVDNQEIDNGNPAL